jgi:hypothetical protein
MKLNKSLILLLMVFAMVAMLVSCTSHKRPTFTWPATPPRAIETTMFEVTGDKGETLRVEFDRDTGKCKESFVNGKPTNCEGFRLSDTYYCIPPDAQHPANTDINNDGERDAYCGKVKFLADGADIKFEAESAAGNTKCKNVGGYVICF